MSHAKRIVRTLTILVGTHLLFGCSTVPKKVSDLDQVDIDAIAVMPPTFQLTKVGAFSQESVTEMTHAIETEVKYAFEQIVAASEYDVAMLDTSDDALQSDAELRRKIFDQAQTMQVVYANIAETRSKTIDITADGDFDYFADTADADFLLFVRGWGFWETAGSVVKGEMLAALFGGSAGAHRAVGFDVLLLDANTNRILWYNSEGKNEDPRKPSEIFDAGKAVMKPLFGKLEVEPYRTRDDAMRAVFEAFEKEVEAATGS